MKIIGSKYKKDIYINIIKYYYFKRNLKSHFKFYFNIIILNK